MNQFIQYINDTIEQLQKEEQELILSDRKDEANFVRIKTNICDICRTIYNVTEKRTTPDNLKEEYLKQLTRLPENWKISLEKAREHGAAEKIVIEETKLEMLNQILGVFKQIM